MAETRNSHAWRAHLPAGAGQDDLDLLAAGSLPAAWRRLAEAGPDRPALWAAERGWRSRGELEAASARVAGRLRRAGLAAGDRVLVSAATSMDLVVAYLGALRMGLVVVPVNTAYREREVAHIVGDAGPRAAVVDDPERGRWARRAAGGDLLVTGPEVGLPDGDPPPLDTAGPRRPGPALLHLGHHRRPQGGRAGPRQPAGQRRGAAPGLALGAGRPAGPGPAPVPHPRPRGRPARHPAGRGVGRAPAPVRGRRRARRRPRPPGDPVLRGADHVQPAGRLAPGGRAGPAAAVRLGVGAAAPDACSTAWPSGPGSGCWSATA